MLDAPRRLWEITAVTPGESFTLRDTGSGDEIHVIERNGSKGREVGELLLARAVAVEGEPMLVGIPIVVPLQERARVLRMLDGLVDADGLAMWFGSLSLPPRLTNREGEDIVPCRTTLAITGDRAAAVAALDETYERQEDGLVWHEMIVIDGHDRILRGTLRLDGDELVVESNSEERQERLLATLAGLFAHVIVDDEEIDGEIDGEIEEFEEPGDEGDGGGGLLDPADMPDEVRAAVEQFIAGYEERWVDDAVPALGGLTPRQALDDPTRREDLFALLREIRSHELPEAVGRMSADRVERLLGIEHHQ